MPDLTITAAGQDDVPTLLALIQRAYRGEESRQGWTTEADLLDDHRIDTAGLQAKLADPAATILAAADTDGKTVACCEVVLRAGGVAYFGLFAVDPARQAGGLGRQVLAAAEEHARYHGASVLEMTVIAERAELIAWYVRRGYTLTAETRPFPYAQGAGGGGSRTDLYFVVLTKPLQPRS